MAAIHSFALALLVTSFPATAQEAAALPGEQVLQSVRAYANAIGCNFAMDTNDIVSLDVDGDGVPEAIALFAIDKGCVAGADSTSSDLVVLALGRARMGQFFIDPRLSNFVSLPRFIDRIYLKKGQLWFDGRKTADDDPQKTRWLKLSSPLKLVTNDVPLQDGTGRTVRYYYWRSVVEF